MAKVSSLGPKKKLNTKKSVEVRNAFADSLEETTQKIKAVRNQDYSNMDVVTEIIDLELIRENENNAVYRNIDTAESIEKLAESIKLSGLIHNIAVSKHKEEGKPFYLLLSGERRLKAYKLLRDRAIEEGNENDVEKFSTIQCKVFENLSPEIELLMLDVANLETRGGIGNEQRLRVATQRYKDTLMKMGYTEKQAIDQLVEVSEQTKNTISVNLRIMESFDENLLSLLDDESISKRTAIKLIAVSDYQRNRVSTILLALKQAVAGEPKNFYYQEWKAATRAISLALEATAEDDINEGINKAEQEIAELIKSLENKKAASITDVTPIQTTAKRTRATYLNKCSKIDKLVDELDKEDVINNIKNYDKKAKSDTEKVTVQLDKLIAKLQTLNEKLKG